MKRHQNEGARQTSALALFTGLYDGECSATCSCDLLKHAAGGVHDKDQCWGLLDTEEPTGFTDYITCVFASLDNYVSQDWKQQSKTSQTNQPFLMHSISKRGVTHELSKVKRKFHFCLIDHCKQGLS